jgi:hypothetical protein
MYVCMYGRVQALLDAFFRALPSARLEKHEKGSTTIQVLHLDKGAYVFGDDTIGSSVCIRPVYDFLFDKTVKTHQHVGIVGTPGVGKSVFIAYIMWKLMRSEKPPPYIVWESKPQSRTVVWSKDRLLIMSLKEGHSWALANGILTTDPENWWLVDTVRPSKEQAHTVLVSSPNKGDVFKRFEKDRGTIRSTASLVHTHTGT